MNTTKLSFVGNSSAEKSPILPGLYSDSEQLKNVVNLIIKNPIERCMKAGNIFDGIRLV